MEESKKDKIMQNLKDLAKNVFSKEETVEVVKEVEAKFTDNKLADGTIVRYEADVIDTGVVVSVVGEDGSVLPLPAGSYVLEDETTFDVVDDAGTADNVVLKEEEVMEEVPGAPATAPTAVAPVRDAKSIVESIVKETRFKDEVKKEEKVEVSAEKVGEVEEPVISTEQSFASIEASFKADFKAMEEKVDAQNELIKAMFDIIESYGTESSVKPTATKKDVFKRNVISKERAKELHRSFKEQLGK